MKKKLYVYDWFNPTSEMTRWLGADSMPVTPPVWIRDIAVEVMARYGALACNSWTAEDYVGGLKTCENDYCAFRIFNGGRDCKGRPNRWVMLLVHGERNFGGASSIFDILESDVFLRFANVTTFAKVFTPKELPSWRTVEYVGQTILPEKEKVTDGSAQEKAKKYSLALTATNTQEGILWVEKIGGNVRLGIRTTLYKRTPCSSPPIHPSLGNDKPKASPKEMESQKQSSQGEHSQKLPLLYAAVLGGILGMVSVFIALNIKDVPPPPVTVKPMKTYCKKEKIHVYVGDFDCSDQDSDKKFYCPKCYGKHEWSPYTKIDKNEPYESYPFKMLIEDQKKHSPNEQQSSQEPEEPPPTEPESPQRGFQDQDNDGKGGVGLGKCFGKVREWSRKTREAAKKFYIEVKENTEESVADD